MTWRHMVVRGDDGLEIKEVYTSSRGKALWTGRSASPTGDTLQDLRLNLFRMLEATYRPEFKSYKLDEPGEHHE